MADVPDAGIPAEQVRLRLEELRALYAFGPSLRDARILGSTGMVPDASQRAADESAPDDEESARGRRRE